MTGLEDALVPDPPRRSLRLLDALLSLSPDLDRRQVDDAVARGAQRGLSPIWAVTRAGMLRAADLDLLAAVAVGVPVLSSIDVEGIAADVEALNEPALLRIPALAVDRRGPDGCLRVGVTDPGSPSTAAAVRAAVGDGALLCIAREDALRSAIRRLRARRTLAVDVRPVDAEAPPPIADATTVEAVLERDLDAEGPAARLVDGLLGRAADEGASDVHLEPVEEGLRVRYRIDGVLRTVAVLAVEHAGAGEDVRRSVLARLKVLAGLKIDEARAPQSGRVRRHLGPRPLDLRLEVIPVVVGTGSHESAVLRLLAAEGDPPSLAALGFSEGCRAAVERITDRPQGLVLVVGPTGSGKSTTLFACLALRATPGRKVLSVEDPVEHRLPAAQQVEVIPGKLTFASALRSFLRQDPDVILVGETRDRETAQTACDAALTGHLVLTSLHTSSASESPLRLVEMGVEAFLVANTLTGVVSQRLVRRLCPSCRRSASAAEVEPLWRRWSTEPVPEGLWRAGDGCARCRGRGHVGRTALTEVMEVGPAARSAILRGATADELARIAVADGMAPIREEALAAVQRGLTSLEEVHRVVA